MALTYGFFDSVNGDRKYNADQMSEFFSGIVTEGVFQHLDGGLAVTAGTGLTVNMAAGKAIIQNRWVINDAPMALSIDFGSETYGRKDAVVLRLNSSTRNITVKVVKGTPAASPVAPAPTRANGIYDIVLAHVTVAAGASSVTVTDKRSDSSVCGWASVAQATSGEVDQMLNAMKTGFDGVTYASPAAMVQGCDQKLQGEIDALDEKKLDAAFVASTIYTTTEVGLINHNTGNIDFPTSTSYKHVKVTYDNTKLYKITGFTWNNNAKYSSVTFVNSSNQVIGYYPSSTIVGELSVIDELIDVPENTYYIYANGYNDLIPVIKEGDFVSTKETIAAEYKELSATLYVKDTTFTTANGVYDVGDLTAVIEWPGYSKVKYEVTPGNVYVVTCQTINQFTGWIFGDANDVVISSATKYDNRIFTNLVLKAPDSAKYLYLNGKKSDVTIQLYETSSDSVIDILGRVNTLEDTVEPATKYATYLTDFINMADAFKRMGMGRSFAYSGMQNGYMTLIFDDGRHDLSTVESICEEYNIPLCAAIMTNVLGNTCDNGKTVKQVCQDIVANGGEILSHSVNGDVLTSATDIAWLKAGLMQSKEILVGEGFDIRGFIRPGGTEAIDWEGNNLQRFTQMFYDFSDRCGDVGSPYYNPRTGLGYTDMATAKGYVDDAIANNKWYTFMSHTLDGTERYLTESYLREFIEYALQQGILFKTYSFMYDHFATWS